MHLPVLLLTLMPANPNPLGPGDHTRSLEVDKRTRTYLVHIPTSYDGKKPYPVVLAFHGGRSNARIMVAFTGLNEKADEAGFLVVYPNGTGETKKLLTWNGGNCCGYAVENRVDDVGFVRALLDDLAKVAEVDRKRVYATGISNGAMMAYRLASELSDRVAAIAPVAGPMGTAPCSPERPVSVMHFHGTDDQFAPLHGGRGPKSFFQADFYSADHSIQTWVKANGCPEEPQVVTLPDMTGDGTTVTLKTYGPGQDCAEVILVVIEGGGHTWPGREPLLKYLGKSTRNVSANDLMWEFFQRHVMK